MNEYIGSLYDELVAELRLLCAELAGNKVAEAGKRLKTLAFILNQLQRRVSGEAG